MPKARPEEALEALLTLTEKLTGSISFEDTLAAVTHTALALLPCNHASLRLVDDRRTELLAGARAGAGLEIEPLGFRTGEGIAGWVAAQGEVANVPDVLVDPRFTKRPSQGFVVRSIIAVPLWAQGRVVGVLSASSPNADEFGPTDVLLARLLANCASPAFEKARLERLTVLDPYTQTFNRRYLLPRLAQGIARAKSTGTAFSILMMDLDHFKRVNDDHGHTAGDVVLEGFVDRVRESTRRGDEIVRWGGEEFVLVMPGADPARAAQIAERVRRHVGETPFTLADGTSIAQTVSIGVATWDGTESPERLEQRADAAMYRAKRHGRDRVMVSDPANPPTEPPPEAALDGA
jgi:two-component system, cell cycle response regulator